MRNEIDDTVKSKLPWPDRFAADATPLATAVATAKAVITRQFKEVEHTLYAP